MSDDWRLPENEWHAHKADHKAQDQKLDRLCALVEPMADAWGSATGFFNVIRFLGTVVKWIAAVGAAVVSIAFGTHWILHHMDTSGITALPGIIRQHYKEVRHAKRH